MAGRALNLTAALGDGQCGLTDGSSRGVAPSTQMELEALDLRFSNPSVSNAQGDAQWTQGDAFVGPRAASTGAPIRSTIAWETCRAFLP
jgi:hypothetical protein